jgi:hypothetical protein
MPSSKATNCREYQAENENGRKKTVSWDVYKNLDGQELDEQKEGDCGLAQLEARARIPIL